MCEASDWKMVTPDVKNLDLYNVVIYFIHWLLIINEYNLAVLALHILA